MPAAIAEMVERNACRREVASVARRRVAALTVALRKLGIGGVELAEVYEGEAAKNRREVKR
jgi:hypothetical protein